MIALFNRLLNKYIGSEFGRNVFVLLTGTTIAQAVPILTSPVLARLYTPEDFGLYALFVAISTFIVQLSSAKYEFAIMLPEKEEAGFNILVLSCIIVLFVSSLSLVLVVAFNTKLAVLFHNAAISHWLYVIPLFVLLSGSYNALNFWNNRFKRFKRLSTNRVLRSFATAGVSLGLGAAKSGINGLIVGGIVGQAVTTGLFVWHTIKEDWGRLSEKLSAGEIRKQALRYKQFPTFLLASGAAESAAGQFPIILIASFFGNAALGFFSLAMRMVSLPMTLIAESIRGVFWQKASETFIARGECQTVFVNTFKKLLVLSVAPFAVILFFGPFIFKIVFGQNWIIAGQYAQIMTVMFFLRFISSPLSCMFYIAEKQRLDLVIQICLFVTLIGSLYAVSFITKNASAAIVTYSAIYSVKYIVELLLSYSFSKGENNGYQDRLKPI